MPKGAKKKPVRILYLDCPMGVSGDMFLAALIDLGVDHRKILRELRKLPVDRIDVSIKKEVRHSITGTSFRVKVHEAAHHRTFRDIKGIISGSALAPGVKRLATGIFRRIAEAEGKVHGIRPDEVHFHEIGAMDSIIDIVGAAIAVEELGADRVVASPIPLGSGWADTMHGRIPIPAPATLELLKGVPVASSPVAFELTTPTGAAIVSAITESYGPMPSMSIEAAGYGAGKKDFRECANLVRAVLGTAEALEAADGRVTVIETNIDDMTPQVAGYLMERLLEAGALDAFYTPVQMKKSRPGVLLTVLARKEDKEALLSVIFSESTSIGVRTHEVERHCLRRSNAKIKTQYGTVLVKASYLEDRLMHVQPEYEDCRRIAREKKVPLKKVIDAASAAAARLLK